MVEKVKEKISFFEVMKDVIDAVARLQDDYIANRDRAQNNFNDPDRDSWWKDNDKETFEEYQRKLKAIEKISSELLKML